MATIKEKSVPTIAARIARDTPDAGYTVNDVLQLTFSNGRVITVQIGDLPENIIGDALMHGLKQKLVDAAAMSRNPDTGRAASIDDKFAAVAEVARNSRPTSMRRPTRRRRR